MTEHRSISNSQKENDLRIAVQTPLQIVNLIPVAVSVYSDGNSDARNAETFVSLRRLNPILLLFFFFPAVLCLVYFFLVASDVYISEAKFVIRAPTKGFTDDSRGIVQDYGAQRALDETFAALEFLTSRDAASQLAVTDNLREVLSRPEADMFVRYPNAFYATNEEQFFLAYRRLVEVDVDLSSGICTLMVRAFRPDDAQRIAHALLLKVEGFVNSLAARSNQDDLAFSRKLVDEARARVAEIEGRIAEYRDKQVIFDPDKEAGSMLSALTKSSTELSQLEVALAQSLAMAPLSPTIEPLREKIRSLRNELDRNRKFVVGDHGSLVSKLTGYDPLVLERVIAGRSLNAAVIQLERARLATNAQRLYLQRIVEPNIPAQPLLPYRFLGSMISILLFFILYLIIYNLLKITLEHDK